LYRQWHGLAIVGPAVDLIGDLFASRQSGPRFPHTLLPVGASQIARPPTRRSVIVGRETPGEAIRRPGFRQGVVFQSIA